MGLKIFPLPDIFKNKDFSKIDYTDLGAMKKMFEKAFNSTCLLYAKSNNKSLNKKAPDFINFKKYCIIEYIKYLDYVHKNELPIAETINPSLVMKDLKSFFEDILPEDFQPNNESIKGSLKYLKKNLYISVEERIMYGDNSDDGYTVESYTCNVPINNAQKYMINKYVSNIFETKEFCIELNTTKDEDIEKMIAAIKNTYSGDIIFIEHCKPEEKKNGYNHVTAFLRIVARKDSNIFAELSQRKHTNQEKGKKKK